MSQLVQISDFNEGYWHIPSGCFDTTKLQAAIDFWEVDYVDQLLGCTEAALFRADLVDGVPQDPTYLSYYTPFCFTPSCCEDEVVSKGMVDMLKGFIYYYYLRDNQLKITQSGLMQDISENSIVADLANLQIRTDERRNRSVRTFNAIKNRVKDNTSCCQIEYLEIQTIIG